MARAKYQFEDFLTTVSNDYKDFVVDVHKMLLQEKYRPKISITKSTGFQLAYHQPQIKTTAGIILIIFKRKEKLMIRLYGKNHKQYLDELNDLPEQLVSQIEKADNCVKFTNPDKCWKGCLGYEFQIRENLYQKCMVNCFEFQMETLSTPAFLTLIESESKARFWCEI